jgi:hypothetical protein
LQYGVGYGKTRGQVAAAYIAALAVGRLGLFGGGGFSNAASGRAGGRMRGRWRASMRRSSTGTGTVIGSSVELKKQHAIITTTYTHLLKVTNAKPRACPVSLSVGIFTCAAASHARIKMTQLRCTRSAPPLRCRTCRGRGEGGTGSTTTGMREGVGEGRCNRECREVQGRA